MYIHVPREKRTNLDPFGRNGIFVGYIDSAKAYQIYLSGQKRIKLSRDVTFEEDVAFQRSRHADSDSDEQEAPHEVLDDPSPLVAKESMEDDDSVEPTNPIDPIVPYKIPRDIAEICHKRRHAWVRQPLQDAKGHATPCGAFRESKRPQRYGCYVALMSNLLDFELSTYDEASRHLCWRDVMTGEYESILKNDVWETVSRPEGKSIVTSK